MKRGILPITVAASILLLAILPGRARAQEVEAKEPNRGGVIDLAAVDPAVALERLRPAEGYEVSLFASEKDFPLGNPVALAFDGEGRLWVSTMPTYPHYKPGDPPTDKLIILEDTDGDGRADKHTVFADSLYLALGFELGDGGVYISQQPNLMFLKDTDGDGVADERRIILHGFGTEDSHHSISAFTWGPGGGLYFQEGTFLHSQVETPFGPVRLENAGVWRYEPHTERLSVLTSYSFSNPWGHTFDAWGQNFIADASSGNNYFGLPISGHTEYPRKHPSMRVFTPVVRPTAGAEIVSSRHFPEEVQGNFLVTNVIGFQGIKNHQIVPEGSGFTSREMEPLLTSTDINFRPIEMEFGPDGALYITDWFNPLIGHMQYSLRDPRRDTTHGRIWRLTYKGKPLLQPVNLKGMSVPALLEQLKAYEDRTRYRARRELRERGRDEVLREVASWIGRLDSNDAGYEHHLLEALWVQQSHDRVDPALLGRLLRASDHRARAAATRVLRYSLHRVGDPLELLQPRVHDDHPLVRLEAVVALSFIPDARAAEIALEVLRHPMDYYLDYGLSETIGGLEATWKPRLLEGGDFAANNPEGIVFILDRLAPEEVARVRRSAQVNAVLLRRAGIPLEVRRAALRDLAGQRGEGAATVLLAAIDEVDAGSGEGSTAGDLASLLAELPRAELASARDRLERLAAGARSDPLRQGAYAALMRATGEVDSAWRLSARSPASRIDLLAAIPLVGDEALRQALRPRIRELARGELSAAGGPQISGRYVRIEKPGCCETLSLAEVEVLDAGFNLARGGEAEQKSTTSGGEARRAVDGNTAGSFRLGSVAQSTTMEADPWWEVDLGEERPIAAIRIWKRSDTDIATNLNKLTVRILDAARQPTFERSIPRADGQPLTVEVSDDASRGVVRAAVRALIALPGDDAE
ncbi:MAG TPA: PVC-type heme-binding CxxCH protein, partial [Longimicrobiaceae bacterium]